MTQLIEFWLPAAAMIVGIFGIFFLKWRRGVLAEATDIFSAWLQAVGTLAEQRRAPRGLLIDLCMPPDRADDVIYNLLGRYEHWVEKHGPRWARVIFFLQSAGSILTFWSDWMLKRVKLLKMFVSS
jgi:hypothetical protein